MADEVAITGVPNTKVTNLSAPKATFDGTSMTLKASWKVPSWLTDSKNPRRATDIAAWFGIYTTGPVSNLKKFGENHYGSPGYQLGKNGSSVEHTFNMSQFFPFKADGPVITSMYVCVHGVNSKGSAAWSHTATAYAYVTLPTAATLDGPELDEGNGHVTCKVESTATKDMRHWQRTFFTRDCYDSQTKNTAHIERTVTDTSWSMPEVDVSGIWSLSGDRYWSCTVTAEARGLRGPATKVTKALYISQPKVPTIKKASVSGTAASSKVSLSISTNETKEHPVTGTKMQVLRSSPYTTAAGATADAQGVGWEDMDYSDDGQCTMLVCEVSDVRPDPDTYTWVRVKTWNLSETQGNLHRYSEPVRLTALETKSPTASNDVCGIIALTPSKAGTSFTLRAGWTEDSPNTGLEVSWADSASAWTSTDGPSTSTFEGNGSASTGTGYARERTVTVSGLASGTTYWVRVRRYLEADSKTTYTAYSKTMSVRTESAEDDACGIASVSPRTDGTGATVIVGFSEDAANTGTELTWSTDPNAWYSTEQPQTFEATWHDASSRYPEWGGTAMIFLRGLEAGTTYYVRARRYLEAGGNRTYTAYSATQSFMTPAQGGGPSSTSRCGIVSIASGEDGTTADLVVGWTESEGYDSTEVTWSDREDAWESTEQPNSFNADWADSESQSSAWKATATVHIEGLEMGTMYWVRVRRVKGEEASGWSDPVTVIPTVQPDSVTLSSPAFLRRGRSLELRWSYGGGAPQTAWRVMSGGVVVMEGEDEVTGCVVSAERMAALAEGSDSILLSVEVSTGGDFVASETATVTVADPPTLSLAVTDVTAQPVSFGVTCSSRDCDLAVVIAAVGATGDGPAGTETQALGDTVWSGVLRPTWADATGGYSATVVAPTELDLWHGARYSVTAVATDSVTGLASDEAVELFEVDWAHRAPAPAEPTVTPFDTTDQDGFRTLGATVALAQPTGSAEGDLYDLYRVTHDGTYLVAEGLALDATVTDRYAPFGDASYRVVTRTVDGDEDWLDFGYSLRDHSLRVDFGGGYVELPYNLAWSDGWQKDFEGVTDMTGVTEGYWGAGTTRKASLSTDLIKIRDGERADAVRRLAQHVGPCFVRTPDGSAYAADVQVSGLDVAYNDGAMAVSLDATQVALTRDYMADAE